MTAAKDAAEAASRAKSDFLANMSHELCTPLNAIIGFSSMMRDRVCGPLGDKYVEYAGDINASGSHFLAGINDILDLTKAESNCLTLSEMETEIGPLVSFGMNLVQRMAVESGVACDAVLDSDLPMILADPGKLRKILINLLTNAVKFAPPGGNVVLRVKWEREGGVTFCVEDTGIGIPADKISVALSPFGQVDTGLARKY